MSYQRPNSHAIPRYVAQNPDSVRKEAEEEYETGEQRELRQIFQGQGQVLGVHYC